MSTKTSGVKYIGSKASLIPSILKVVEEWIPATERRSMVDVFTGTTRVAQAFKAKGWSVTTSDLSWASSCYSNTWIGNPGSNAHLQAKIDLLNALPGVDGWITKNYCDVKGQDNATVRVWQPKNGRRADAIRNQIDLWSKDGTLQPWETDTLITSLILALDKVDNTVGVQQAYLKTWCSRSSLDLKLELPPGVPGPQGTHLQGDALTVSYPKADLAYLDPPYSSHSYATYYHIWDSLAKWDQPQVGLKTNRRVDRISKHGSYDSAMDSQWNSKKAALAAFEKLIDRLPTKWVLVSYSNESLVEIEKLEALFAKYPFVTATTIDYERNIMSQIGNASLSSKDSTPGPVEYLFLIQKES